jgi:GTP-binding protein YchF
MKMGIIGLPAVGKTTIFNALTGGNLPTGAGGPTGQLDVHSAVVDVPDARLDRLSALFKPRKTTYAKVTYADIGGLRAEAGREGLPGPLVNQLSQMDGLLHIVRAFDDATVPHAMGSVDPARDMAAMEAEFILNDMLAVERRQARLAEERQKGGRDRGVVDREIALFQRLSEALSSEQPLRELTFSTEEDQVLSGFALLSRKPMLIVVNTTEGSEPPLLDMAGPGVGTIALQGRLEMEISQLGPEETKAFLDEYGLGEPVRDRVIRASYELLGLESFFTVGEDEVRAWTLREGSTALQAADAVHTDLARGFIRAEVIAWDALLELGGLAEARAAGKLRIEGKDYVVTDGEVVHIRFNI